MKYDATGRAIYGFPLDEDLTVTGNWTFTPDVTFSGEISVADTIRADGAIGMVIDAAQPVLLFSENDAATDEGNWRMIASAGTFNLQTRSDDGSVNNSFMTVERTGDNVDSITWAVDGLSRVRIPGGGGALYLSGLDASGENYIGFYESAAFSTRKGYIGYGGSASDELFINNEEASSVLIRAGSATNMIAVNSTGVGFHGQSPAARPDYTVTNPSTDRALNVTGDTLAQVAAVVGTIIADLIAIGLFQ